MRWRFVVHFAVVAPKFENPASLTMSSREIAELTGKDHKNVKRDIELMFESLEKDGLSFERIYLDSMNRQQIEYELPKDLTFTLVLGSRKIQAKRFKKWITAEVIPSIRKTGGYNADPMANIEAMMLNALASPSDDAAKFDDLCPDVW